ncbi:MAG: serine/threonine protein phosphatase [Clostridia bacterium]|nr:serine/threonine protein phosphatase [Clostridia bacterium]
MNYIKALKNKSFASSEDLKYAIENAMDYHWHTISNNDELMAKDEITTILNTQKELLQSVIDIHEDERTSSAPYTNIIDDSLDLRALRDKIPSDLSIHQLYYLKGNMDCYFIGDLHSDAWILKRILSTSGFYEKIQSNIPFKLIFLGDYVDRGKNHIKIIENLMMLKYLFPKHIYLLMGNHDIGKIENGEVTLYLRKAEEDKDYFYIYLNMLHEKFNFDLEILELYQDFLNHLNVAAFILSDQIILKGVHGGIPRPDLEGGFEYLSHYKQLTDGTLDYHNITIKDSILWSDPSIQENKPTIDKKRFKFYEDQLNNYLNHLGLDAVVRGHQAVEEGCLPLFNHKIYTIFSTGMIIEKNVNINPDTKYDFVTPKILHFNQKLPLVPMEIK